MILLSPSSPLVCAIVLYWQMGLSSGWCLKQMKFIAASYKTWCFAKPFICLTGSCFVVLSVCQHSKETWFVASPGKYRISCAIWFCHDVSLTYVQCVYLISVVSKKELWDWWSIASWFCVLWLTWHEIFRTLCLQLWFWCELVLIRASWQDVVSQPSLVFHVLTSRMSVLSCRNLFLRLLLLCLIWLRVAIDWSSWGGRIRRDTDGVIV